VAAAAGSGGGAPHTTAPPSSRSARDDYLDRTINAWKTPIGNGYGDDRNRGDGGADQIASTLQESLSPGAKPGYADSGSHVASRVSSRRAEHLKLADPAQFS